MRIEGADWWFCTYAALMALGFVTCLFEIRSYIIKAREATDRLRDREHAREMEWLDKQIELAKAQNGIVDTEHTDEGSGAGGEGATPATQPHREQHP